MAAQANIKAVITAEDRASKTLSGFGNSVNNLNNQLINSAKAATLALAAAAAGAVGFGVKVAANLETTTVGFSTLLGSAEEARKIMDRIKKEAARTPFEIAGLSTATQLLTAVTKNGDRALDFILNIGEGLAAMGRGQAELDRIAVNLQQIAATGRAFGIDIRQFAFAGIPIYEMLQEEIGLTGEALQEFIEDGGVTFELLEKMFKSATQEGGRWAGAFKNQAGTFNQSLSNLKDSFSIFLADLTTQTGLFKAAKDGIKDLTTAITENKDTIIEAINTAYNFLARIFRDYITPAFMHLANAIRDHVEPRIREIARFINEEMIPAFQRFWAENKDVLIPVLKVLGFILENVVILMLRNTINIIEKAIHTATFLADVFTNVRVRINEAIDFIQAKIGAMPEWFKVAASIVVAVLNPIAGVLIFIAQNANEVINAISRVIDKGKELANSSAGKLLSGVAKNTPQGLALQLFDKITPFAEGTSFAPGGPALVGEKGPELVYLPRGSQVVPNQDINRGAATTNLVVNVGVYAGTDIEKRKLAQELFRAFNDLQASKGVA